MNERDEDQIRRIKVQDKRRSALSSEAHRKYGEISEDGSDELTPEESTAEAPVVEGEIVEETAEPAHDYLDDLRRLQAEFDNYRKRMMREQTQLTQRAGARLIEKLLPVLDNFDRAIEHSGDAAGLQIVYKDLLRVLGDEGLEEIASQDRVFDPQVHEAVESHDDPEVDDTVVKQVYRKGYRLREQVLRPAMVVVARPAGGASQEQS